MKGNEQTFDETLKNHSQTLLRKKCKSILGIYAPSLHERLL